jgi:hypothetical protein
VQIIFLWGRRTPGTWHSLLESGQQPVVTIEESLAADHPYAPIGEIQAQGVTYSEWIRAVAHARDHAGQDRLETTGGRDDEAVRVGMEAETARASLISERL